MLVIHVHIYEYKSHIQNDMAEKARGSKDTYLPLLPLLIFGANEMTAACFDRWYGRVRIFSYRGYDMNKFQNHSFREEAESSALYASCGVSDFFSMRLFR